MDAINFTVVDTTNNIVVNGKAKGTSATEVYKKYRAKTYLRNVELEVIRNDQLTGTPYEK